MDKNYAKSRQETAGRQEQQQAASREHNLAAMAGFVANQIRTDPTEVYGDGLRDALAAYQEHGLGAVFAHVRRTGELPR